MESDILRNEFTNRAETTAAAVANLATRVDDAQGDGVTLALADGHLRALRLSRRLEREPAIQVEMERRADRAQQRVDQRLSVAREVDHELAALEVDLR